MSTEAHEPVSPTWDALRKLGEQCPHPLKVEGECLIVLDSDRRRFTDLGTPEMAQFVLASVNYVRSILPYPAAPVLHDEKDLASYWKAAHDRVVAQNWELSRQIGALQKVGEQCLSPQQTTMREAAEAVTKGFSALEVLLAAQDADIPDAEPLWVKVSGRREEIGTYGQLRALRRALNLAHPQQGGERDGVREALESIKNIGRNARFRAPMSEQDWKNAVVRMEREAEEALASRPVEEQPTAPTSASKSSGEEA